MQFSITTEVERWPERKRPGSNAEVRSELGAREVGVTWSSLVTVQLSPSGAVHELSVQDTIVVAQPWVIRGPAPATVQALTITTRWRPG